MKFKYIKGYQCYYPSRHKIFTFKNVTFDDNKLFYHESDGSHVLAKIEAKETYLMNMNNVILLYHIVDVWEEGDIPNVLSGKIILGKFF